jgi:hypothetical protein
MKPKKLKPQEHDITKALNIYFSSNFLTVRNIFMFGEESDVLTITRAHLTHEIEIKISRSDFKKDFKKEKHRIIPGIIDKGAIVIPGKTWEIKKPGRSLYPMSDIHIKSNHNVPNKFSYCTPKGLITKDEIPDYAGLYYFSPPNTIIEVRPAKFIHKEKFKSWDYLAMKLSFRIK